MSNRRYADYLVCYDIREPRRLARIHRRMRGWGIPLQYSVFYCRLSEQQRKRLVAELQELIDARVDDVRVYSMQAGGTIHFQGRPPLPEGMIIEGLKLRGDEKHSQLQSGRHLG